MCVFQEMDHHDRFLGDLWKRFVVDEEIECHVNYGFTSSRRRFGESMKVQELNTVVKISLRLQRSASVARRRVSICDAQVFFCCPMGKGSFLQGKRAGHEVDPFASVENELACPRGRSRSLLGPFVIAARFTVVKGWRWTSTRASSR